MNINKMLVKYNFVKGRSGQRIKYIVIHDTGNAASTATARAHFNYFNSKYIGASAHYFVDEKEIVQIIEDSDTAWHVGDGKGKYDITNSNSIGVEICINDGNYITEIKRTIELVGYLMEKHNIPLENVVRHYDASRKLCPAKLSTNNWEAWNFFKIELEKSLGKNIVKLNFKSKDIVLTGFMKDERNWVQIREVLEKIGHKVEWEQSTQTVVVK